MNSMFQEGSVLPRPLKKAVVEEVVENDITEQAFFESVEDDQMLESIEKLAQSGVRKDAAAACIQWAQGGDSDFNELDAVLFGMAGGADDEELTDSQAAIYESLQESAGEFIAHITDKQELDFELMLEDNELADKLFESLETGLADLDSDEALAEFAVRESMMMEAMKKVIRNGEMKLVKTKKRKRRMSAAQKAALKKARSKSNSGAARAARKKSMRKRKSRGM
jgi:hypothetical protein